MIHNFFKDGKLTNIPKKKKNKQLIFDQIIEKFQYNNDYSEKEVNDILKEIYPDFAILRRYLVDWKLLERDKYGNTYRKINYEK